MQDPRLADHRLAPDGRVATMDVATGAVTIEREELREQVLLALQHHAFDRW